MLTSQADESLKRLQEELDNTPHMMGTHERTPAGFTIQEREGFITGVSCLEH